jgi:2,3-bisphosphoglycerate-independent phosphoglycerate mutase
VKLIYLVIDGMGDLPIKEMQGKTPLEAADTPNLDSLAKSGKTGMMYTVGKGLAPESDVAVISILGYDPFKYHISRGVLESIGAKIPIEDGDLALRCNFATINPDNSIIDRRAGRNLTQKEADELAETINDQIKLESYQTTVTLKSTSTYRVALVIKSKNYNLSGNINNTDPAYKRVKGIGVADLEAKMILKKCSPLDKTKEARISSEIVNEFTKKSRIILDNHKINRKRINEGKLKANILLCRDAGSIIPKFPFLCDRYDLSFVCLADMNVERGISLLAGMSLVDLPPPSNDLEYDCKIRVRKLLEVLTDHDCFYVHIKGPDVPAHDGDYKQKSKLISIIDKHFVGELLKIIDLEESIICVTSDHSTPCELMAHSADPVPILVSGGNVRADSVRKFSEKDCKNGEIGILKNGFELIPKLVNYMLNKEN